MTARVLIGALLVALSGPLTSAQSARKIETSAKAVAEAAGTYVVAYQKEMAFVLADELAGQRVTTPSGDLIDIRQTRAEFFLTYLPNEGHWIAVRDVREVDGAPVVGGEDIRSLIQRAPLSRLAGVIAEKNARFNIGDVRRTFNEPTFALLVVEALNRRRFNFDRVSVSDGPEPVVTLKFKEKDRPTLVSGTFGEPVFMTGELEIDAATGRVQRTRVEMTLGPVRAMMTTTYAPDGKLGFWVPVRMSERYEQTAGSRPEVIAVETSYTNYQRFDATVIIK